MLKYYFTWFTLVVEVLGAVAFVVRGFPLLQAASWYPAVGCFLMAGFLIFLLVQETNGLRRFPERRRAKQEKMLHG